MAQVEEADSDGSEEVKKPRSRSSAADKSKKPTEPEPVEDDDEEMKNGEDEDDEKGGDEDEEEYEIEAIVDAKRGKFRPGEYGYLVKWKGYGDEENSWVSQADAENANELIEEFFRKRGKPKDAVGRAPVRPRASKGGATSTASSRTTKKASPGASTASGATKRGRNRGSAKAQSQSISDDDEDEVKETEANKKPRTNGTAKRISLAALDKDEDDDEDVEMASATRVDVSKGGREIGKDLGEDPEKYTTMKELGFNTMKSWENLVKEVRTVERVRGEDLMVYFEITGGKCVREPSSTCALRFPLKLIKFYEEHLRWRISQEDVDPNDIA